MMFRVGLCLVLILAAVHSSQHPSIGYDIESFLGSSVTHQLDKMFTRNRRHINVNEKLYQDHGDVWKIRGLNNLRGCPKASETFKVFHNDGNHYAIIATNAAENNTEIYQFSPEIGCGKLLATLETRGASDFEVVSIRETVRIIVLGKNPLIQPHKRSGLQVYILNFDNSLQLTAVKAEVLPSQFQTCLTSWEQFGVPHLAICNNKTPDGSEMKNDSTRSYIFHERGGYFDLCGEIETRFPQAIRHFSIFNQHYVAVANNPKETESEDVPTEIFKYDHTASTSLNCTYKHWQYLPTKAAKDLCFFTLGTQNEADYYLLAVNRFTFNSSGSVRHDVNSHIYKFVGEKFEPFQSIPVQRATGCFAHQTEDGRFALLISTQNGVVAYQYNGWRFVPSVQYSRHSLGLGIKKFGTFSLDRTIYLTVANNNSQLADSDNLFTLAFELSADSTLSDSYRKNLAKCLLTRSELRVDPIGLIVDHYQQAVKKNDSSFHLGKVIFANLSAGVVSSHQIENRANSSLLGAFQINQLKNLSMKSDKLTARLNDLNRTVKQSVRVHGNYSFQGPVRLHSLTSRDGISVFKNVTSSQVNLINISDIFSIVALVSDLRIPSSVLCGQLIVRDRVETELLSDHDVINYLQVDDDFALVQSFRVNGQLFINGDVKVSGLIDGRSVSPSDILLQKGNQHLNWTVRASTVALTDLEIRSINSENMQTLYNKALTNSENFTLVQPTFKSTLSAKYLKLSGLVNGIDIVELDKNSMKLTGNQIVTGVHVYNASHLRKAVLHGSLNLRNFPEDFISTRKDHLKVSQMQLIVKAHFDQLKVSGNASGIPVVNGHLITDNLLNRTRKDIQVVLGMKTFDSIKSGGEVTSQTINGRPMNHFDTESSIYGNPNTKVVYDSLDIRGNVKFEKPIKVNHIEGVDLNRFVEKGVPLSTDRFPPRDFPISMANVRIDGDLNVNTLDGVPSSDFLTKDAKNPFTITGRKTFSHDLAMLQTFSLLYHLNGYNLSSIWAEALKVEGDQVLRGNLVIENNVDMEKLEAVNSPFVTWNNTVPVTGKKHFEFLTIDGDWFVDTLSLKGQINEIDINSWGSDTVMKNKPNQIIKAEKMIYSLTVENVLVSFVEGLDIDRLIDLVSVDEPATIHSDLVIAGPVSSPKVIVSGLIDGVHSDAPLSWLRYQVDQNISGSIIVNGSVVVGDYDQDSWMVGDINLTELINRTVHIDQPGLFDSLHCGHLIIENLELSGAVQGFKAQDLVLKFSNQSQIVNGLKSFIAPLVSESLRVSSDFNEENPQKLCQSSLPPQPSKWVVYGNVTVEEDVTLNVSLINNQNLSELLTQIWLKTSDVKLLSNQTFQDVVMNGSLQVALVNRVNLTDLSQRSVKLTSTEQIINVTHRLSSIEVVELLMVDKLESIWINDVNISQLTHSILLRDVEQNISNRIVFQDVAVKNLVLDGQLNGLLLNKSVMRNDRNDVITGRKSLSSLTVREVVEVCPTCLVDDVDVSQWAKGVVLRQSNLTLSNVQFESLVFQQPIVLEGKLNNVSINRDHLLTLSDSQTVDGSLTLSSLLPENIIFTILTGKAPAYQEATEEFTLAARFTNLQINGLYDGVNLSRFYNQSIIRNADVYFKEPVVLFNLEARDVQDSSNKSTLRDVIELPPNALFFHVAPSQPYSKDVLGNLSGIMNKIERVVSHQTIELKYFEEVTAPPSPPVVDATFAMEGVDGQLELCFFISSSGELFYSSISLPVLKGVEVTGVASAARKEFAVAALNRSTSEPHNSFIFSTKNMTEMQTISTDYPLGCIAFTLFNQSCYLFIERTVKSPIYCRNSDGLYSLFQELPTIDGRLATIGYHYNDGLPLLAIGSAAQRGYNRIIVWTFNTSTNQFVPWKTIVTLQFISMDCNCDDVRCFLATVVPSKPAAIPGQVIIWSLNDDGQPTRVQRLAFLEPTDVKFSRLPDGRLSLMVLQRSGIDNVMVYVWRNLLQFQLVTTVRVPGAQDFQLVSNSANLLIVISVHSPSTLSYGPVRVFRASFLGKLR